MKILAPNGSQLNSTAIPAHLPQNWAIGILIFSIAMAAEYSFFMKSIETHARTFLSLIILPELWCHSITDWSFFVDIVEFWTALYRDAIAKIYFFPKDHNK